MKHIQTKHIKTKPVKSIHIKTEHIKIQNISIYKTYQKQNISKQNISNQNISKPNLRCIRVEKIVRLTLPINLLMRKKTKSGNFNKKYHKLIPFRLFVF